jgi:hypothetical protein
LFEALDDLPDGLFGDLPVQPSLQKYFASPFGRNSFIDTPSRPHKGRIAIVTDVGYGMRWPRQRRKTSGVVFRHRCCAFRSHKRVGVVIQGSRLEGISTGGGSRVLTQCST